MKTNDKYKKLLSNSIIFAIGNLGSKVITFLMVPLYTYYLTTGEYGTTDLVTTITGLLVPLLTLSTTESVFRFSMIKSESRTSVLSNGLLITAFAFVPLLLVSSFMLSHPIGVYVIWLSYISAIELMIQQFARGIGKSAIFAITGLLMSVLTVLSNIIMIVFLGWRLSGYLVSLVVAQIGGIVYLIISLKAWKYIRFSRFDRKKIHNMLEYSVPLIPNQISWWLSNSASKVFIAIFLGTVSNGFYAVANKIPSLISVFTNIFTQAWQISAVEEFEKKNNSSFFNNVLRMLTLLTFAGVLIISGFSHLLVLVLSNAKYLPAVTIVPWLSLAVGFSTISSFLGAIFGAHMKTQALFTTTIAGALINVAFNLLLIPTIGLVGAGVGAYISFLVVAILRYRAVRKFLDVHLDWKFIGVAQLLVVLEEIGLFSSGHASGVWITYLAMLLGLLVIGVKIIKIGLKREK